MSVALKVLIVGGDGGSGLGMRADVDRDVEP